MWIRGYNYETELNDHQIDEFLSGYRGKSVCFINHELSPFIDHFDFLQLKPLLTDV